MMLVKYYAIDQKNFHPGVFDRLYDVLNFLVDNFALLLDRVLCLDKETFPYLAVQSVFSPSVEVGYGGIVCKVHSIWDRM